jgi:hypothetical protein
MVKAELPIDAHSTRPWRIHGIADGFRILDVWALPTPGGPNDFERLIAVFGSFDAARSSPVVRALFAARWTLGRLLHLDDETGSRTGGLRDELPADLRDTFPADVATGPFTPLYAIADEAAMEIVNRTVHGILHLAGFRSDVVPTGARWRFSSSRTACWVRPIWRRSRRSAISWCIRRCSAAWNDSGVTALGKAGSPGSTHPSTSWR